MNPIFHAGLAAYMRQAGIALESDASGKVALTFDGRYRVRCWPAAGGDLVLESNVAGLPEDAHERAELLADALSNAAARLYEHADTLTLAEDGNAVCVQQRIAAQAGQGEVEAGLEQFVNAVANWRQFFTLN